LAMVFRNRMAIESKIIFREKAIEPTKLNAPEKRRWYFRKFGALLLFGLFIACWFVPRNEDQVTRLGAAYLPIFVLMLGVELTAEPDQKLTRNGRWRVRPARAEKIALLSGFGRLVLHAFIAVVAFRTVLHTRNPSGAAMSVLRLAAGTALLYAAAAFIFETIRLGCLLLGYSAPALHRTPLFARSLGEFWARRWNIAVSAWFQTHVFRPVARLGYARAGILCAFAASGFFHAWPMLAGLGVAAALSTMAFFLIQGVFVLLEDRLRIQTWPVALARTWTIGIILASSPLFIDPALRVFGL
jgi:hypothetical protein